MARGVKRDPPISPYKGCLEPPIVMGVGVVARARSGILPGATWARDWSIEGRQLVKMIADGATLTNWLKWYVLNWSNRRRGQLVETCAPGLPNWST
jgi:hypothetical protein